MSENNLSEKSSFIIMDEADNQQIQDAGTVVKQVLAYESRGKKQLSYMGIKWLVLKMSQKEQSLEIVDLPCIELMKHDGENQNTWIWCVTVKVRNLKTGLVTLGASESPFLADNNKYDTFGRTKAISKAERNAYRKQISEIEINAMLETIPKEDIKKLESQSTTTPQHTEPSPVAVHYLETLKNLGYIGIEPKTSFEAAKIIDELKSKDDDVNVDYDKYCTCDNPVSNSITNGKTCQNCKKLMRIEV